MMGGGIGSSDYQLCLAPRLLKMELSDFQQTRILSAGFRGSRQLLIRFLAAKAMAGLWTLAGI